MKKSQDISIWKIINYNLLFFIPLVLLYVIAYFFSGVLSPILEVSRRTATSIIMVVLSLILFFILIPMLRIRETVKGVRLSLFLFIITGFLITVPSLFAGNTDILLSTLLILANFVFSTFIMSPDVIGISGDPNDWVKHKAQIMIFIIYVSIILLYIFGFGWMYYSIAHDPAFPDSFHYSNVEQIGYPTFIYYSIVTMATVGYGDISPISPGARLVMTMQTILGMIINVVFIAILMMYVSTMANQAERREEKRLMKEEKIIEEEAELLKKEESKIENVEKEIENIQKEKEASQYQENLSSSRYPNYMNGQQNNYYKR